jgi:hypothetical protein
MYNIKATVVFVCLSGQCLKKFSSHCPFLVMCFVKKGRGPGKLRNFLIWEFRSLWQLLPNWHLMDLARERFRFRPPVDGWWPSVIRWKPVFKHPVDGWCTGECWITLAQCDPMETMGWNWDFMDGVKLPPRGQFTWSVVFFFSWAFFLSCFFFFFPCFHFFPRPFFSLSFFFFLK